MQTTDKTEFQRALERNKGRLFRLDEFIEAYDGIPYIKQDAAIEKVELLESCRRAELFGDRLQEFLRSPDVPHNSDITAADFGAIQK